MQLQTMKASQASPPYSPQDVELARLGSSSSSVISGPPPPYDDSTSFYPTAHFQIETPGKPWCSLPLPPRPDPIPIFSLPASEPSASAASALPKFTSLRPERHSGSCCLVSAATQAPLSTTTYRFGPNRPPRVRLFAPSSFSSSSDTRSLTPTALRNILLSSLTTANANANANANAADTDDSVPIPPSFAAGGDSTGPAKIRPWDAFAVTSAGLLTRAVRFRTRLGTFSWRYASRRERRAWYPREDVPCLLVLERVVRVARARNAVSSAGEGQGKGQRKRSRFRDGDGDEELRTPVAHFLRGPGTRTPGSTASSAGNGGRLVIDERALLGGGGSGWPSGLGLGDGEGEEEEEDDVEEVTGQIAAEGKEDREMGVAMVVTTCLMMLKREVDRRRAQQIAIMAGVVAGS
ncbi:hypothetical protein VTK26DRAFT_3084 [Humicola hyalothermophila]